MFHKRLLIMSVLALLIGLATSACTTPSPAPTIKPTEPGKTAVTEPTKAPTAQVKATNPPASSSAQTLLIGSSLGDVGTADPHNGRQITGLWVQEWIFNHLVRFYPGTIDVLKIEGDLAESWKISDDKLTWTFTLRKGVKWHKGFGEVTAEDVKFSFERMLDPKTGGRMPDRIKVDSVTVVDKYTVAIKTKTPDPFFLQNIADRDSVIISKAAFEKFGKDFGQQMIGSGPFQFESYSPKQKYVVTANEEYFRGAPNVKRIELLFIADETARHAAFMTGKLDLAVYVGDVKPYTQELTKAGKKYDNILPGGASWTFIDISKKPLDDLRVRQALAYGVDWATFVDEQRFPGAEHYTVTSTGFLGVPGVFGYSEEGITKYEYNPTKAKQLLTEAGYPNGFKLPVFVSNNPGWVQAMIYAQDQLKRINVQLDMTTVDNATWLQKSINGENRPFTPYNINMEPDAYNLLSRQFLPGAERYAFTNYDKVADLVRKAGTEFDPAKRALIYKEIGQKISQDLVVLPGTYAPKIFARQPYVDIGYEYKASHTSFYPITEKIQVNKKP